MVSKCTPCRNKLIDKPRRWSRSVQMTTPLQQQSSKRAKSPISSAHCVQDGKTMLETSSNSKRSLCNLALPNYEVLSNLNSLLKPQFGLLNFPSRQSCPILLRMSCINQCTQSLPKLWCRSSSINREFSSSSGDCRCSICCRDNAVNLTIDKIMC